MIRARSHSSRGLGFLDVRTLVSTLGGKRTFGLSCKRQLGKFSEGLSPLWERVYSFATTWAGQCITVQDTPATETMALESYLVR